MTREKKKGNTTFRSEFLELPCNQPGHQADLTDLFMGVMHKLLYRHPVQTVLRILPAGSLPHLHGLRRHKVLLSDKAQVLLPVVHRHLVLVNHLPARGYASPPLLPAKMTHRGKSATFQLDVISLLPAEITHRGRVKYFPTGCNISSSCKNGTQRQIRHFPTGCNISCSCKHDTHRQIRHFPMGCNISCSIKNDTLGQVRYF